MLRLLVCTIALVPVSALPSVHSSALVCRSPIPDALDGDECPAVLRCNSAHGCAWMAIQHVLPSVASISVVEVARHAPWGFFEFGSQRHNVALADFDDASARQLLRRVGRSTTTVAAVFHILVGEGVSRRKWRAAVASAMRAGAVEVWVMEHDRLAKSWLNRSAWPIGHDSNPPREDGSEFFTLTELRAEVQSLARLHCGSRTSMLASCQVPSSIRDRRRNLLVGVQCNCLSRADRVAPVLDEGATEVIVGIDIPKAGSNYLDRLVSTAFAKKSCNDLWSSLPMGGTARDSIYCSHEPYLIKASAMTCLSASARSVRIWERTKTFRLHLFWTNASTSRTLRCYATLLTGLFRAATTRWERSATHGRL